jgi:DeoR/GlpR family transcriptional regulator of sugar metabolism
LITVPPALRRAQILQRIRRDCGVSVAELARDHAVSPVTVHRDLEELAREGLVERVHGGARALSASVGTPALTTAWTQRANQNRAAKDAIAAYAVRYVAHGSTIFLDASSSALALARLQADAIHVVVVPGELDQHMRMIAGRWAVEFLAELNFALAFVSAAGISLDQGLTTARRPLADVINAARASADRTIGLIDATKFGRSSLLSIAPAHELDAIVTDAGLAPEAAEEYRAAGVRLEIANSEEST